ncbi:MAG: hypothetical protein ABIR11_13415, partial [Candidatus Limnocylindrales bacterium]
MDVPRSESAGSRYDELHAAATEALGYAGNTLRSIRDRYRAAYLEELARWETLHDDLIAFEHQVGPDETGDVALVNDTAAPGSQAIATGAASAAEVGAADLRLRMVRSDVDRARTDLGRHETEL